MSKIYLAGPISGRTFVESERWREEFKLHFRNRTHVHCLSPLRAKLHLADKGVLEQSYDHPLSSDRGIMTRDHNDCLTSDLIVCNLLGVERVSIGTVMECAWAHAYRKPLVLIIDEGNVHDHPMIREAAGFRVGSVEVAASVAMAILGA